MKKVIGFLAIIVSVMVSSGCNKFSASPTSTPTLIPNATKTNTATSTDTKDTDLLSDLLGKWILAGDFLQSGTDTNLLFQINEIEPKTNGENTYLAVGCMQTDASGSWAPLSLQADFNTETNNYELNILSTILPAEADSPASVIRFVGGAEMYSSGVDDDRASGLSYLTPGEVAWTGRHINQQIFECPQELDEMLHFQGEVNNLRDLAFTPPLDKTNIQAETNVVSAQMQVETPDGQVILASYWTDIFTPHINFIDSFRFSTGVDGTPIIDEPYHFTLLDVLGKPISGVESRDSYIFCDHGAATNIRANYNPENFLELSWDAPELIPGRFDPENDHGLYQLALESYPRRDDGRSYGAQTTFATHKAPWTTFEPGSEGLAGGTNYGVSLSELEDGDYIISVATYNYYEPAAGEVGFDCRVVDSRQNLIITKLGNTITYQPSGAVSGFIYNLDGDPQGGIAVEISGANTGFYEKVCSAENGYYVFTKLPLGTFTLSAGEFGAENCNQNSFATFSFPEIALTASNPIHNDIDFFLSPKK